MTERVEVRQNVLKENDRIAAGLREEFGRRGILCLNLISSPGAGKTSILEGTLEALRDTAVRAAVLTGDIQTERDADRLKRYGFPALQITTGGTCHLDASMVESCAVRGAARGARRPLHRERRQPRLPGVVRPGRGR